MSGTGLRIGGINSPDPLDGPGLHWTWPDVAESSHGAGSAYTDRSIAVFLFLALPDGETVIFYLMPGELMWLEDGLEHAWEMLSGEAHVVAIEVKSAAK